MNASSAFSPSKASRLIQGFSYTYLLRAFYLSPTGPDRRRFPALAACRRGAGSRHPRGRARILHKARRRVMARGGSVSVGRADRLPPHRGGGAGAAGKGGKGGFEARVGKQAVVS